MRRGRDSNSRYPLGVYTLSRRASSTTRAPLLFIVGQRYKIFLDMQEVKVLVVFDMILEAFEALVYTKVYTKNES